jgi:hypothetical protein
VITMQARFRYLTLAVAAIAALAAPLHAQTKDQRHVAAELATLETARAPLARYCATAKPLAYVCAAQATIARAMQAESLYAPLTPAAPPVVPPPVVPPPGVITPGSPSGRVLFSHPFGPPSSGTVLPEFPRDTVDTTSPIVTRHVDVPAGSNLTGAFAGAQAGDELDLDPGATYVGPFTYAQCPASGWITVRTRGADDGVIPRDVRVTPTKAAAANFAKLVVTSNGVNVLDVPGPACRLRLIGVELTTAANVTSTFRLFGVGNQEAVAAQLPHHIILDRVYLHGNPLQDLQRCAGLDGNVIGVIDSWIGDCHAYGFDSQAIIAWNGQGPYLLRNNHLEGAGENVMFGGADPKVPNLVPADIVIVGNHFFKPFSWRIDANVPRTATQFTAKNLLEFKNATRVLVERNVLENSWPNAQTGGAILIKSSNQSGAAPWSTSRDVTVRSNVIRCANNAFSVAGHPETYPVIPAARIAIYNNLGEEIGPAGRCGDPVTHLGGDALAHLGVDDFYFANNEVPNQTGRSCVLWDGAPNQRATITANICSGQYPFNGTYTSAVAAAGGVFTFYLPPSIGNVAPAGNLIVPNTGPWPTPASHPGIGPDLSQLPGAGVVVAP